MTPGLEKIMNELGNKVFYSWMGQQIKIRPEHMEMAFREGFQYGVTEANKTINDKRNEIMSIAFQWQETAKELAAKLAIAVKALKFYGIEAIHSGIFDHGEKAREALRRIEEK